MTTDALITKLDATREQIVRALLCAIGKHEAWEQDDACGYKHSRPVHLALQSDMHDRVHCAVCKHCRTLYVRRKDE